MVKIFQEYTLEHRISILQLQGDKTLSFDIETMRRSDWKSVRAIYAEGLATGLAAFITAPPRWKEWSASYLEGTRLVARSDRTVLGWAALAIVPNA